MNSLAIQTQLIEFLSSTTGRDSFAADTDLFDAGVTDSLTMMDLLVFVETAFHVRLGFEDLTPDVFRTPNTLANLIARRLSPASHSAAA
jgi:acyl carrier protein